MLLLLRSAFDPGPKVAEACYHLNPGVATAKPGLKQDMSFQFARKSSSSRCLRAFHRLNYDSPPSLKVPMSSMQRIGTTYRSGPNVGQASRLPGERASASGVIACGRLRRRGRRDACPTLRFMENLLSRDL